MEKCSVSADLMHFEQMLLPYPGDCSRFCSCESDERALAHQCPEGLHFNGNLQACDMPGKAKCSISDTVNYYYN